MSEVGYMAVSLHLSGLGFDPLKLKGKFNCNFEVLQKIGEIVRRGPGRGTELSKSGFCYFEAAEETIYLERIEKIMEIYGKIKNMNELEDLKIDWFHISILFTGLQGNMELNPSQMKALSKSEEGIAMTYIGSTDFDYRKQKRLQRLRRGLYLSKYE